MIYKSCEYIEHGLYFATDALYHCCHIIGRGFDNEKILNNYNGESIDWEKVIEIKNAKREAHKRGEIAECCKDCVLLREQDWDEENYINNIFLSHFTKCNSKCTYCFTAKDKKHFNSLKEYL